MVFSDAFRKVIAHQSLNEQESYATFISLMKGEASEIQMGGFLSALRIRGESVEEIVGAAKAMRDMAIRVHTPAGVVVDTCGTGGDEQNSFNFSTAAAFVVAGAGYTVAKHGNRSVSSRSGSADIMEALGIPLSISASVAETCLNETGLCFLFAPAFHPAMKQAASVRKALGIRTIFNILGPLTNPALPNVQILGVFHSTWIQPLAQALQRLGCQQGSVLHSQGHDEIVLSGTTFVADIVDGQIVQREWLPEDFGLKQTIMPLPVGGDATSNSALLMRLLHGEKGLIRDIVCMNAAAAIAAANRLQKKVITLKEAFTQAQESIDNRQALHKLESIRALLSKLHPTHV